MIEFTLRTNRLDQVIDSYSQYLISKNIIQKNKYLGEAVYGLPSSGYDWKDIEEFESQIKILRDALRIFYRQISVMLT